MHSTVSISSSVSQKVAESDGASNDGMKPEDKSLTLHPYSAWPVAGLQYMLLCFNPAEVMLEDCMLWLDQYKRLI